LVADGIITQNVSVTFELLLRRSGDQDLVIGSWNKTLSPRPSGFDAIAIDLSIDTSAIAYQAGDLLVFRYSGVNGLSMSYIPNGEGARANGRIPVISLPQ
jgi:hypothetical protein